MKLVRTALRARRLSFVFMLAVIIYLMALPLVPLAQAQSNAPATWRMADEVKGVP